MTSPKAPVPREGAAAPERPPGVDAGEEPRLRPMVLFRWGVYVSLGVLATLAAAAAVYTARAVLVRVAIALFVAISLDPAVRVLTRWGMRRGLAVMLIFLLALGLVAAFLLSVIPTMVDQFQSLVRDFPGYLANLQDRSARFRELSDRFNLTKQLQSLLASLPGRLGSGLLGITGRLFGALFSTLTVLVLTVYFMADLPRLRHGLVRLFPRARRAQMGRVADVMIDKVGAYMIGNILISIVAGLASFIAFMVLGVPFSVPLAFVVALADLIPMVGATLGAAIAVLVSLFATELWPTTVLVAVFFVVYQQVENYFVAPRILRSTVNISAAAVLLAGLIGATALGLVGALMAIPIAAGLKVVLTERLQARDAAEAHAAAHTGTSRDREPSSPAELAEPTEPPPEPPGAPGVSEPAEPSGASEPAEPSEPSGVSPSQTAASGSGPAQPPR